MHTDVVTDMHTDTEAALDTTWVVDPDRSSVGFTIAHFGVATVKGSFGTFAGKLADNRGVLHANGTVDPATVDTRNPLRDRALRRAEFFDIDRRGSRTGSRYERGSRSPTTVTPGAVDASAAWALER